MAKKKIYVVRKGRNPGFYDNWAECQKNVTGFKGAEFKSFENMAEAEAYMKDEQLSLEGFDDSKPYAFVDGSFNKAKGIYGWGGFLVENGQRHLIAGNGNDPTLAAVWNIAGELMGATEAMKMADELKLSEIYIFYDYVGIEKWAKGEFKSHGKKYVEDYIAVYKDILKRVDIKFVKVKGHSGIEGNEEADAIARYKAGVGLEPRHEKLISKYI